MNRRETADLKHQGLPVAGYKPQDTAKVALVNANKEAEERVMRILDELSDRSLLADPPIDERWLREGRLLIEQGFMAVNRAIFQPGRVKLAEDDRIVVRLPGLPQFTTNRVAGQSWREVVEQAAKALKNDRMIDRLEREAWSLKGANEDADVEDEIPEHRGARLIEVKFYDEHDR